MEDGGTLKVAVKNPAGVLGVTAATVEPSKVIATVEIGTNPLPVTVTKVATVPEVGLSEMVGLSVLPDVEKFHSLNFDSYPYQQRLVPKLNLSLLCLNQLLLNQMTEGKALINFSHTP